MEQTGSGPSGDRPLTGAGIAVLALMLCAIGVPAGIVVVAETGRDFANAEVGIHFFLRCLGAVVATAGTLGTAIGALRPEPPAVILRRVLLLAAGLAVFTADAWALIGLALAALVYAGHDRLAPRAADSGDGDA